MRRSVIALFILILPLLEIAGFVVVGSRIGALATVGLVIASGVLGSVLVYRGHVVHAAFFRTGDARGAEGQTRADHHARDAGGTGAAWRIADPRERARRRKMR